VVAKVKPKSCLNPWWKAWLKPAQRLRLSIYGGSHIEDKVLVAEIYRPMAEALTTPYFKDIAADILDATRQAGREIKTSGKVSNDTMARVKQPMVENTDAFLELGNLMWKTCIAEGITPREFGEKGVMPRPDSISSY
jgi:hypothetical protein